MRFIRGSIPWNQIRAWHESDQDLEQEDLADLISGGPIGRVGMAGILGKVVKYEGEGGELAMPSHFPYHKNR